MYFTSQGGGPEYGGSKQEPIGEVDLVDGQVTTIAPDLSGLLPGTLEALVMHGGAPLASTLLSFQRSVPGVQWPQHECAQNTDAEGRVRLSVRPGEYRVVWAARQGESSSTLRSTETAIVRVGETTRQTFTILTGMLKVHLVDSTGAPVANVRIELEDAAGAPSDTLTPTSKEGRVEQRYSPGTFTAYVMPKRLQDQKALMEFYRTVNDAAAIRRVRVQVGTVNVLAGQTNEVELKLPADW
jgi:5-hydroxyisourate hydrolase-like protein (transthyretin family)